MVDRNPLRYRDNDTFRVKVRKVVVANNYFKNVISEVQKGISPRT